jgi:hypothetical protein
MRGMAGLKIPFLGFYFLLSKNFQKDEKNPLPLPPMIKIKFYL